MVDPKKLVAYAGVDPSVFESGKFSATKNRITKRGSSRLRHASIWLFVVGFVIVVKRKQLMKSSLAL